MVWAHILSMGGGGMMSPFDFRDLMKAHMRYDETRTVEQVLEAQKNRSDKPDQSSPSRTPTESDFDRVRQMQQRATELRAASEGNPDSVVNAG